MSHLSDLVTSPPRGSINTGLSPLSAQLMLNALGKPGELTRDCSDPTGDFRHRITRSEDVGPFAVSGLDVAVASLIDIFEEVKLHRPDLYSEVKTEGMLCVRHIRSNPSVYSNHSWGAAIDLYFGGDVVPQGSPKTSRGVMDLYFYFHKHGWYWGAGFSGARTDSMHFELARQTVQRLLDLD